MYTICKNSVIEKKFNNWWDLIGYINNHKLEDWIAHNDNDIYQFKWYDKYDNITCVSNHERYYKIYEDDRIINLSEIRDSLSVYVDHPKNYKSWYRRRMGPFTFRKDPVPGIGHGHWGSWYRDNRTNKNYFASILPIAEKYNLKSARLRNNMLEVFDWDLHRSRERGWKASTKKRNQWEKHL